MSKTKQLSIIVFFGAIWGILEATLGYFLQFPFMPFFVSGLIMFPIAAALLIQAYLLLNNRIALLWIGVIAASIKGINLFLPMFPWRTINPMVAIILESLLMVGVITMIVKKPVKQQILGLFIASFAWRSLFLTYMGVQFVMTGFLHNDISSFGAVLTFIILFGSLNAGLAYLLHYALMKLKSMQLYRVNFKLPVSISLLVVAFLLSYYL